MYIFWYQNDDKGRNLAEQAKWSKKVLLSRKKTFAILSFFSYLAETVAKRGQNRENRESFCSRKFLPIKYSRTIKVRYTLVQSKIQAVVRTFLTECLTFQCEEF